MKRKRWLFPLLAVLMGLVGACILVEAVARLTGIFRPPPAWAQELSAQVGYIPQPHARYTYPEAPREIVEFENEVTLNARGLHDVDHTPEKPEGTYRVLLLGDSFIQAREVPIEENLARRLEAQLNAAGEGPFEVINAGHYGLGTAQELLYYRHEGVRYDSDLVLVFFYIENDIIDSSAPLAMDWYGIDAMTFPYFEIGENGALLLRTPKSSAPAQAMRWLRHNSFIAHAAGGAILSAAQRAQQEAIAAEVAEALPLPLEVYLPPDETWAQSWELVAALMAQFRREVEADGAAFGVVIIEGRAAVDWQQTLADYPALAARAADPDRPHTQLHAILNGASIPYLDPVEALRTGDKLYYPHDGHFTPRGHQVMAEKISSWVQAQFMAHR